MSRIIPINSQQDIIVARKVAKEIMESNGFGSAAQTRMATAISELTRNVIKYAGEGECSIEEHITPGEIIIKVSVEDNGPGIDNIEQAMKEGFSTGKGLGAGLPGAKKLVNNFNISSRPGLTKVNMEIRRFT